MTGEPSAPATVRSVTGGFGASAASAWMSRALHPSAMTRSCTPRASPITGTFALARWYTVELSSPYFLR